MEFVLITAAVVVAWTIVAAPVAVLIGRVAKVRDERA